MVYQPSIDVIENTDVTVIEVADVAGPAGPPGPQGPPGPPGSGGGAPVLTLTSEKTSNYTAAVNDDVLTNIGSGNVTITLPPNPANGSQVRVRLGNVGAGTNTLTIQASAGDTVDFGVLNALLANGSWTWFSFRSSDRTWLGTSGFNHQMMPLNRLSAPDGNINMVNNRITNLLNPSSSQDALNLQFADGRYSKTVAADTIWDNKGDIVVAVDVDTGAVLPVGTNSQVLTVDSTTITGLKWATPAAGGGGGVTPYTFVTTKTANYTANANEYIPVDATSGVVTITLPPAPTNGTRVAVDVIANPSGNNVTVSRGGTDLIGNPTGTTTFRIMPNASQKWRAVYNAGCWYEDIRNGFTSAGNTPITPTATLTSTNVQLALQELDGDIQAMPTLTSSNTGKVPVTTSAGVTIINVDKLQDSSTLTTKGDLYVATASNVVTRLPVGTNNQVLTADSSLTPGVKWANPAGGGGGSVATDLIWDTKGDLAVATAADTAIKVAVGTDGQALVADSAQTAGVKWAIPSTGDVYVHMTTDASPGIASSTVQVLDTGFTCNLAASSKYAVEVIIFYSAETVSGRIKSSLRYPTGATSFFSVIGPSQTITTPVSLLQLNADHNNLTWSFGSTAAPPVVNSYKGHGIITTTNAGALEFWYAQIVSNTTATIRLKGSYIHAKKL